MVNSWPAIRCRRWVVCCVVGAILASSNSLLLAKPNIILIMADDVGWESFGCYGGEDYKTPHIDSLAAQGIRFTHCYSTPICTTSRVKLMTGQYNFRNYTHFGYLNPTQKTFGQLLKAAGYKTAVAGKWQLNGLYNELPGHLDKQRPHQLGFDDYLLWQLTMEKSSQQGGERYWSPPLEHNGQVVTRRTNDEQYGPDLMCDFICDFMQRNQDEPFFVYYPMLLVHNPFVPTPDTIGDGDRSHAANRGGKQKSKENFGAMVEYMDKIVGRIASKVDELGLAENTLIMFTADNGTNRSITSRWQGQSIRGGKGGMTDMGTHVPFVAYWKGVTPAQTVLGDLIDFTDFYPTLAEVAGISLSDEDPADGRSFLPQLQGEIGNPRDWVLCHYQPYWVKQSGQFVRNQQFKLYRDGRFFDIQADMPEQSPLKVNELDGEAGAALQQLRAVLDRAPPAPPADGSRTSEHRPTYPTWPLMFDPGD